MQQPQLIPHLFRTEFSKITAVLTRLFGIDHIEIAEDLASETFLQALESWTYHTIPENPVAWLYAVAKNKAKNHIARDALFAGKIAGRLADATPESYDLNIDLSEKNITDSQLQMLFAICHPAIAAEAQIGLALRVLCGFGINEIANALLSNKQTINKRLFRAKEKLRQEQVKIEFPGNADLQQRLDTILQTLYLLFNEGYYSESNDAIIREDLCLEAMRLTYLLLENPATKLPQVYALLSLMCFHASRFEARRNDNGELILYDEQDESLWNQELITKGAFFLREGSVGSSISKYHLEANIAYWYTIKTDSPQKWETILQLFNQLLQIAYSPVAALNRTYALAKANGKAAAIIEAEKLKLTGNHFYFTLLGELYTGIDQQQAKQNFEKALCIAKTETDKRTIERKLAALD